MAFFNEDGITLHVNTSSDMFSGQSKQTPGHSVQPGMTMLPYFMAVNSFEQEEAVIAKRFRSE